MTSDIIEFLLFCQVAIDIFSVTNQYSYACNLWSIDIIKDGVDKNNLSVDGLTKKHKFDNNYFNHMDNY
ncbi:MAG TPA: hypothetical protein DD001_05895 [Microcoleaceae bacterium UBA10368]|nr:hypothetical protein [Microcoleaceae cyanobacterium UBA10368]